MTHSHNHADPHALRQAIRIAGGASALAKRIGISKSRVDNWLNREVNIPYDCVWKIAMETHVDPSLLAPNNREITQYIQSQNVFADKPVLTIATQHIVVPDALTANTLGSPHADTPIDHARPIVVTDNLQLLAGYHALLHHQQHHTKTISAVIINPDLLLQGSRQLADYSYDFSISERARMGIHLESLIENQQGKRTDLRKSGLSDQRELYKNCELRFIWNEVNSIKANKLSLVAKIAGFESRTRYWRAKKVLQNGRDSLVSAMDREQISISWAASVANKSPTIQAQALADKLDSPKRTPRPAITATQSSQPITVCADDLEYLSSQQLSADLSYLLIGLSVIANAEGEVPDNPQQIQQQIFPHQRIDITSSLQQLIDAKQLMPVWHARQRFLRISKPLRRGFKGLRRGDA